MSENEQSISEDNLQVITNDDIERNIDTFFENKIVIWRKNIDNRMVTIPKAKLQQYLGSEDSDKHKFYIVKDWQDKVKDIELKSGKSETAEEQEEETASMEEVEKFGNVEEQLSLFSLMSIIEREEILDDSIEKLSELKEGAKFNMATIIKMVEVIANTFYANNANLEDNISSKNIQGNIYGVLVKTNWIVQILIDIFGERKNPYNDYKIIDEISTGSVTIDHMNKVLLRFITFLIFYNEYIDDGLFTKNIRGGFKDRYHRYYRKLFPDSSVSIEVIFKDGIRRIDKEKELQDYAVGALLYDIGKIPCIEYHDGHSKYDVEMVKKHVLNGYNMVVNAKKYPFDVLAMTAFHHEYYGGKGSYKFSVPLLTRMSNKKIVMDNIKYFITFDKDEFQKGECLSYFPCKVLEIIDVFDALIDKKKNSVLDALQIMKKEFITKSLKIDPILFRIFLEYNVKCGLIKNDELEDIESIKY